MTVYNLQPLYICFSCGTTIALVNWAHRKPNYSASFRLFQEPTPVSRQLLLNRLIIKGTPTGQPFILLINTRPQYQHHCSQPLTLFSPHLLHQWRHGHRPLRPSVRPVNMVVILQPCSWSWTNFDGADHINRAWLDTNYTFTLRLTIWCRQPAWPPIHSMILYISLNRWWY